ncbi:MAG: universal stress protein [Halobacteria archaeon]
MTCIMDHILLPVASEDDAEATAAAVKPYISDGGTAVFLHVIEKAGGAMDKASVEQREEYAEETFAVIREIFDDTDADIETEIVYGTGIAESIIESAHDNDADSISFTPRGGSKIMKLLTGNVTDTLVQNTDLPLVVLPRPEEDCD